MSALPQWLPVGLYGDPLEAEYHQDPADVIDAWAELVSLTTRPAWHREAACRGNGADTFFPSRGDSHAPARAICQGCPVAAECLAAAMADPLTVGVWAGTTGQQRHRLRQGAMPEPRRRPVPMATLIAFVEATAAVGWPERLEQWNGEHPERPFPSATAMAQAWRYARAAEVA